MNTNADTATLRDAVDEIIDAIRNGQIIEIMQKLYDVNVEMAENTGQPTRGLNANLERERHFLASVKEWKDLHVDAIATDGTTDQGVAFIEYGFDFINTDNAPVSYQQVSVQRWQNGKVVSERFYYNAG